MRERERGLGCGLQRWDALRASRGAASQRAPHSRVRRTPGGGAWGRVPGVTLQPCSLRAVYTALPALFCNQSKPSPGRGNLIRGPRPRRGEVCARQKGLLLLSRLGRELGDGGGGPRAPEEGGLSSTSAPVRFSPSSRHRGPGRALPAGPARPRAGFVVPGAGPGRPPPLAAGPRQNSRPWVRTPGAGARTGPDPPRRPPALQSAPVPRAASARN